MAAPLGNTNRRGKHFPRRGADLHWYVSADVLATVEQWLKQYGKPYDQSYCLAALRAVAQAAIANFVRNPDEPMML